VFASKKAPQRAQDPIQQFAKCRRSVRAGAAGCGRQPLVSPPAWQVIKNVHGGGTTTATGLQARTWDLLSDYISMIALSQPKSGGRAATASPAWSNLTLHPARRFSRERPDGLTPADAATDVALYQADPPSTNWLQQGDHRRPDGNGAY